MPITLTDNEFFTGLANLAIYQRLYSTNNSRKPESMVDLFATDILDNGNMKIFPYSALPTVTDYSETSSLLTVTKVATGEETIKITEKKVIKSSYSRQILEMAFTSDSGMNMFVGYIIGQMDSAKIDYLYDDILNDFKTNLPRSELQNTQTITITLRDPSSATTAQEEEFIKLNNNKKIAKTIQEIIQNIEVFNTAYNAKGLKECLNLEDLRLMIGASYDNDQIIDLFATLLKSSYIQESFAKPEKIVIPTSKQYAPTGNTVCYIMHKRFYQYFYKFTFMGSFFDVSNLVVNNFKHFWYGKGFLTFLPFVELKVQYA